MLQARLLAEQHEHDVAGGTGGGRRDRATDEPVVGPAPAADAGYTADGGYRHGGHTYGPEVKVVPLTREMASGGMAALGLGDVVEHRTG